jgi:hypothetical protein
MDAHERRAGGGIAENQCERGLDARAAALRDVALEAVGLEHAPSGGQAGGHDPSGPARLRRS